MSQKMATYEIDGSRFSSPDELYDAILDVLGAPPWHGRNINALIDSMIYGGINTLQPPYKIIINNFFKANPSIQEELMLWKKHLSFPLEAQNSEHNQSQIGFLFYD